MDAEDGVKTRLSAMMALVYSVQGAFWPLLSIHLVDLGISERGRGWIFATMAMATFAVPLGAGQLVDRLLPTQRFLSISLGAGTILLSLMALGVSTHVGWLFGLFLAYWLLMAPSNSLAGSLAFRNLSRPDRDFGKVRLWGTVGWMAVGWLVSGIMAWSGPQVGQGASEAFWVAAALSGTASIYCLTLPNTPPIPRGARKGSSLGDVVDLVRTPGMTPYLILTFGLSLTTPFVYQVMPNYLRAIGMDRSWVSTAMTLGQWPEIAMLAVLPWLIRRFGFRRTLALGLTAYAVRYASLVFNPPLWVATAGIALHGVGVACFSVAGQMFVDRLASRDRRASAQSFNTMISGGLGSLLGSLLAGEIVGLFPGRYGIIFLVPCAINVGLILFLACAFRPETASTLAPVLTPSRLSSKGRAIRENVAGAVEG